MTLPAPQAAGRPLGFVPARHRWLPTLLRALRGARIALRDAVLADGVLRVTVMTGGRKALSVCVRPLASATASFAQTRRFHVGFEGNHQLDAQQRAVLSRFRDELARMENEIPSDLVGFATIGPSTDDPVADVRRLFPFLDIERSSAAAGDSLEVLVRATPACNQSCPFCSAPHHHEPSSEALRAAFSAVAKLLPGATLTITGGEPSLRSAFVDELGHALALPGLGRIAVQTNGVPFAKKHDPAAIPQDPRLGFFVSLHGLDPKVYDACTGTRGQLEPALAGIRRLLGAGHALTLNCVVNANNLTHLDDYVAKLPSVFPEPNRPRLHFSVLICPEGSPDAQRYLVRYSELAPAVERAARVAEASGTSVESLLSSTHAALPACSVSVEQRQHRRRPELASHETGHETAGTPWVKSRRCVDCVEDPHCLGVPRPYAERFGLDELVPVEG